MDADVQPTPAPGRRRRFRWSVRTCLLLVVLAALPMAWVDRHVRNQRRALAATLRNRGWGYYDYNRSGALSWTRGGRTPSIPPALRWLPVECFQQFECAGFTGQDATDDDLRDIAAPGTVRTFIARGPKITDAGAAHLRDQSSLRDLTLDNTSITDAGAAHLATLTDLHILSLAHSRITDAGLETLGKLRKLETLNLDGVQVSPEAVRRWKLSHPATVVVCP